MERKTHGLATLAGHKGARIINDVALHDIDASMVTFSPDAVVSIVQVGGVDSNVVSDFVTTPGTAVGDYWSITDDKGLAISQIQLTAGSANYIK